jgi:hypothetical protein
MDESAARPTDPREVINRHLVAAAVELFAAYGVCLTHLATGHDLSSAGDGDCIASTVGYEGEGIRGSILLLTDVSAASALNVSLARDTSDESLCDSVAEFSNMLLGRLKRSLLAHGVALRLATPWSGVNLRQRALTLLSDASTWHRFRCDAGEVLVRIDVTPDPGFAMTEGPSEGSGGGPDEGDVILF